MIVTRWDWICCGIVIGWLTMQIGQAVAALLHRWIGLNQLRLEKALYADLLKMKARLDHEPDHHETHLGAGT